MKSTGIVRGLDKMGRIVLPMEVRRLLHLVDDKSFVEFYTEEDAVILKNMCLLVCFVTTRTI